MYLAFDHHRIDDGAAIVDGEEAPHPDLTRAAVDIHDGHVRPERERQVGRIVVADRFEAGLHALWVVRVGRERQVSHRFRALGGTFYLELIVLPLQVVDAALEQMRGQSSGFVADLASGDGRRRTCGRRAATGVGAQAVRRGVRVAVLHLDVFHRQTELLGHDLRKRRLVPLTLGLDADADDRRAGRVDANLGTVEHLDAQDVKGVRRPGADDLGECR